ncbi:hypothetical protein CFP65_1412 [Kitasatospora sp. MMS16-BH015]|uniref:hypothetical protein n=1 Tax=Kitasatospora sp. MMS16-BH015 TaxID=2018025 RepID=UPI000CA2B5BE|nr:hypothetical protein [Kitasatospora sp. MMS16-BH015]AUG76311.1 hypothetical protein CFP65_1412 [Kitasatospora sp. MMS16-BH015]
MGPRAWSATVAVNLLLGVPAVVPLWLLWYFAANWPLAELGWTQREPTENDGPLPWLVLGLPIVLGSALLWWLANRPLRRRHPTRAHWPVAALATLTPTLALALHT